MANLDAKTNRLIHEDSPYLQQHAHNPVDWYPWGEEAFNKAKKENKPIFLSIGYSTCHWCHVMERESFENEDLAKILNENFIAIKVDREEYPNIDRHYQDIYTIMNRRGGGWPLTIIMTPQKGVFFSGTYIPLDSGYGGDGLKGILSMTLDAYHNRKEDVKKSVLSIQNAMNSFKEKGSSINVQPDLKVAKSFVKAVSKNYDFKNFGIGHAPKFPHATTIDTLLDLYRIDGDKDAYKMAIGMLEAMSKGGIYDQIEGGFYRYSTDSKWMIPHFEKMLYTNAELLEAYANGYDLSKKERFKEVILDTIKNIKNRFYKDGVYFSASDADSDGKEGKYFVFEYESSFEYLLKLGISKEDAKDALYYLGIFEDGNFELDLSNPYISREKAPKDIKMIKELLYKLRSKRNYPFIDHKVQTSWNALYIKALLKVAKYVDRSFAKDALFSLESLIEKLYIKGELYHQVIVSKKPKIKGYLEDYAFLISALLDAYEVDYNSRYLDLAKTLQERAVMKFYKGGEWEMSDDDFRSKAAFYDASYRSAAAVMVENIFKLATYKEDIKLFMFGKDTLKKIDIKSNPNNYPYAIKAYLQALFSPAIIKSTKENLIKNRSIIDKIKYPYILTKPTKDEKFIACKIDRCFSVDRDLNVVIKKIQSEF
jgi:uncharacterized protein YyaL (SSP411 family)